MIGRRERGGAETAVEYLRAVLVYVSAVANVTREDVNVALKATLTQAGGSTMTDFVAEWIEEGVAKGKQQATVNSILDILMLRFDAAPLTISEQLVKIESFETLRELNRRAVTAESLAEFEQLLDSYL